MEETLQNAATTRIFHNALHINKLEHQLQMRHPAHRNRERTQLLASLQAGLSHAAAARMTDLSSQLTLIQARLEAHSPEQTLRRGYALVENQDKQLIPADKPGACRGKIENPCFRRLFLCQG